MVKISFLRLSIRFFLFEVEYERSTEQSDTTLAKSSALVHSISAVSLGAAGMHQSSSACVETVLALETFLVPSEGNTIGFCDFSGTAAEGFWTISTYESRLEVVLLLGTNNSLKVR